MAYGSVIAAVIAEYETLGAANFPDGSRPGIYLDEAPVVDSGQVRVPYVIIRDGGDTPEWDVSEANAIVPGTFSLDVYYRQLGDADAALAAILWNGQNPNQRAGLAFATLDLALPLGVAGAVVPGRSQRTFAGLDYQGQRVHRVTQDFSVLTTVRGTGA